MAESKLAYGPGKVRVDGNDRAARSAAEGRDTLPPVLSDMKAAAADMSRGPVIGPQT